jgi:predicted dehydrogenase
MAEGEKVGFVTMGAGGGGAELETIGIGMLGYAFMGKAHSNAYKTLPYMAWPPPYVPKLVAIAGRNEEAVSEAAQRYGFEGYVTDWHGLVEDERVQVFDNSGPNNLHTEPSIAAAEAGKHVICEKPLGRNAEESHDAWKRVEAAGVKHMCGFNYRFVPAVRLAREIVESGDLGDITHFRGSYLQEWGTIDDEVWRFDKALAGSGALGDLGAHVIDLARYLVGRSSRSRAPPQPSSPGVRSTTRSSPWSPSTAARSARSRPHASRPGARTRLPGRSTARRARWRLTWSG